MINNIVIMGRLTADPELKTTPTGINMVNFSVAVDRDFVKAGEERKTDFINVVAWNKSAEFVSKYFHKGSMIAVQGSLQSSTYEDKTTGTKRTSFKVAANNISFCGSKNESGTVARSDNNAAVNANAYQSGSAADFSQLVPDDEDLPF